MNKKPEKKILKEIPEKQKKRLYPVVLDLFSKKDFHLVNIREISKVSGLSTTTIYRYFPSKEKLFFTILDEKISEIAVVAKEHIKGIESTKEIFRKLFWVTMDYYDNNPGVAVSAFITVPMGTWMKEESYIRKDVNRILETVLKHGLEKNELDPSIKLESYMDLYYMNCYRQIHRWYYYGMKGKLTDSIPDFFEIVWKSVAKI